VGSADADVVEPAVVAEGELAVGIAAEEAVQNFWIRMRSPIKMA